METSGNRDARAGTRKKGASAAPGAARRRSSLQVLLALLFAAVMVSVGGLMIALPNGWSDTATLRFALRGKLDGGGGAQASTTEGGSRTLYRSAGARSAEAVREAAELGLEPFPRGPVPWGDGDDPSYGTCVDKACSVLRQSRLIELKLPHLKPCKGSAVTQYGDAGEQGAGCKFDDGLCLYVLNTQPREVSSNWVEARFRDSGLFHYADDMCSADIVLPNTRDNLTEAVVEQFLRKDQIVINFQLWNTRAGGLNARTALSEAIAALPSHTMLDAVKGDLWRTAFGTTLDFDPSTVHPMPESYILSREKERARLLKDTEEAAGVASLSDDAVCSQGASVPDGDVRTSMPLVFNNKDNDGRRGNVIVWNMKLLRDVRCDVITLGHLLGPRAPVGGAELTLRVLWSSAGSWVATPLVEELLMPVSVSTGEKEWRLFSIHSFALVASSASPTVLHHDGYLRVSEVDGRLRDIAKPETMLTQLANKGNHYAEIGTLDFRELIPVLREYFPTHPDPVAALRCFMDRAVAEAFAATHDDGAFQTNGFSDRHWWFTFEFVIDVHGRPFLLEANRRPLFDNRLPHSKSTSIEWLSDIANAIVAVAAHRDERGKQNWPLEGVKSSRPVLIDDSTEAPALHSCRVPGALQPFGEPFTSHIPKLTNEDDELAPFPRGPAPWGFGNDPSYGACLNRACSVVSEDRLEALGLPRTMRPCKGSPVTVYGDAGEKGYGCPFVDGRCLFVVDVKYAPGVWAAAKFKASGLFHLVDDLCSADIVFSKVMDNTTEALLEQFMRKEQRIINWPRWNTEAGGINDRNALEQAMRTLRGKIVADNTRAGVWDTGHGTTLEFDPTMFQPMAEMYDLSETSGRHDFLEETATAAGVAQLSDDDVCREDATATDPMAPLPMPLHFRNMESKTKILVWNVGLLRDIRCDIRAIVRVLAGEPGAENTDLRVLEPELGNLFKWRATAYIDGLKMPVNLTSGEEEWRLFKIRTLAGLVSSASPTVMVHEGYVVVSSQDDRYRDITRPETMQPNFAIAERRPRYPSEEIGSVDFAALDPVLRKYFPNHPNPLAAVRCFIDRSLATAFAATRNDGSFETNGFADRHWWFAADFFVDVHGRMFLSEIIRSPGFTSKVPHSKTTSAEFFSDLASAMVAVEDQRRSQDGTSRRTWPLPGVRYSRPVIVDDATEWPALATCAEPGAEVVLGGASMQHIPPMPEMSWSDRDDSEDA